MTQWRFPNKKVAWQAILTWLILSWHRHLGTSDGFPPKSVAVYFAGILSSPKTDSIHLQTSLGAPSSQTWRSYYCSKSNLVKNDFDHFYGPSCYDDHQITNALNKSGGSISPWQSRSFPWRIHGTGAMSGCIHIYRSMISVDFLSSKTCRYQNRKPVVMDPYGIFFPPWN